jgi:hypothetical protein
MAVYKSVRVDCDKCCVFGDEARTLSEVRQALRRRGWYMRSGTDLCPKCQKKSGSGEKDTHCSK